MCSLVAWGFDMSGLEMCRSARSTVARFEVGSGGDEARGRFARAVAGAGVVIVDLVAGARRDWVDASAAGVLAEAKGRADASST